MDDHHDNPGEHTDEKQTMHEEHHETRTTHEHHAGKADMDHETTVEIDGELQEQSSEPLHVERREESSSGAADVNRHDG